MTEGLTDLLMAVPRVRTQALPSLYLLHDLAGYLAVEGLEEIAAWLHMPKTELYAVAASYTEFQMEPPPAAAVYVCSGLSCQVAGAKILADQLRDAGRHVVEHECMFACAVAPVAKVGGEIRGRASREVVS
ncbi:MAG TPA: NAD(P)H-dependent oxidoreductase subunit E [Dehalococcoidia bacterium]|nr:NAD(P)H-dependent oxidoreductase subunit E [Dehalococcoidia bacterium]